MEQTYKKASKRRRTNGFGCSSERNKAGTNGTKVCPAWNTLRCASSALTPVNKLLHHHLHQLQLLSSKMMETADNKKPRPKSGRVGQGWLCEVRIINVGFVTMLI